MNKLYSADAVYCHACGAEMKYDSEVCPRCGTSVPEELLRQGKQNMHVQAAAGNALHDHTPTAESVIRRRMSIMIVSAILLFPILMLGMADLLLAERHLWLRVAELSLGSTWMLVMVLVFSRLSAVQRTAGGWGILFLFLLLLDMILPGSEWFAQLALPVISLCAGAILCTLPIIRRLSSADSSLRIQSVLLSTELAVFFLLLNGIINRYYQAERLLSWSIPVLLIVIPAAGLFVFCASVPRIRNRILRLLHM